jgi:hypothetical protein
MMWLSEHPWIDGKGTEHCGEQRMVVARPCLPLLASDHPPHTTLSSDTAPEGHERQLPPLWS